MQMARYSTNGVKLTTFQPVLQHADVEPAIPLAKYHIMAPLVRQTSVPENNGSSVVQTAARQLHSGLSSDAFHQIHDVDSADAFCKRQQHQVAAECCYYEMTPHQGRLQERSQRERRDGIEDDVGPLRPVSRCRSDDTLSTTSAAVYEQERPDVITDRSLAASGRRQRSGEGPPSSSNRPEHSRNRHGSTLVEVHNFEPDLVDSTLKPSYVTRDARNLDCESHFRTSRT